MKLAILDLSQDADSLAVETIKQIATNFAPQEPPIETHIFNVRAKLEIADLSYDAYVSVGGEGNPSEAEGCSWKKHFFGLTNNILQYNRRHAQQPKHVLMMGYSFMAYCLYYGFAQITKRKSEAWGITLVHKTNKGAAEKLLDELPEPFYAFDARAYQLVKPDKTKFQTGVEIICLEKERPLILLERAIMGIRFSESVFGVQFNGETNPDKLSQWIESRRQEVLARYGPKRLEKIQDMLDKGVLTRTFDNFIPNFLTNASKTSSILD